MAHLETQTAIQERTEDGVLIARVKPNGFDTLESAKANSEHLLQLKGEDPPMPLLVDFVEAAGQNAEARRYYAEESHRWASRVALLIGSPIGRVMGNIYMGLNRPKVPTKLFTSEQEAITWLKTN